MPRSLATLIIAAMTLTATSAYAQTDSPPVAAKKPHTVASPNGDRNDDYYWLRDDTRKNPEMLAYLNAENAWFERYSAHYKGLEDKLFAEIKGRIKEDDASVPYRKRDWWYYTRYEEGKEYPIYARKKGGATFPASASEAIMLDVNQLAAGHDFYQVGGMDVSPGQDLVAYAEDTSGRRQYTVRVKNLATGETYADAIPNTSGSIAWARDEKTLFYVENDPVTLRSHKVKRHVLGSDAASDVTVYEEKDEAYYTGVHRTDSDRYIVIDLSSTESDEQRVLSADTPDGAFKVFAPRRAKFHYSADHIAAGAHHETAGARWIVRTDWDAPNYKLMQVGENAVGNRRDWKPLIAASDKVFINGFALFANYLAIDERSDGLRRLRVVPWSGGKPFYIDSNEPAYTNSLGANPEQDTDLLRYTYTSLTTPSSVYEIDMKTGEKKLLKVQPVLGGFDAANYTTERVWVASKDGRSGNVRVPVSLVYRKGFERDADGKSSAPLLQYGYGSYGAAMDPAFRSSVLSLLDRGFVYAIAHIRGGEEMGRAWYENGKKLKKKNSFTDFIAVTEALVKQGYGARDKVFIEGGSAGGLLMGAVVNLRPDLYRGMIAQVPFVDVVTTMLDESIPLTTNEFDEWGNPKQKTYYKYMLSYSPYDNVKKQAYPAIFVSTGLFDSQVQYFEPAKWVAKLRTMKTDTNPLVFKINMEAGHGGKSGRFKRLHEVAEEYAFMLDLIGIQQ